MKSYFNLLYWVPESKLDWQTLSRNPNAIEILERNPGKIYWRWLSMNPSAIHLLEQNIEKMSS